MALMWTEGLSVTLERTEILRDIHLSLEAGETTAILGPSGCGKTTLLRALAGLIAPSAGTLHRPTDSPGQAGVRVVFQEPRLLPWLTLAGNIQFALEAAGVPRAAWPERMHPLLAAVGLSGQEGRWPHQLSGGMAQRAALVRALAPQPAVLLLDEPFAALDAQRREQLQADIQGLIARSRCAALVVTHDVLEALVLGDQVLILGGQPSTILHRRRILAPRPRGEDFRLSPETLDHLRWVRGALQT